MGVYIRLLREEIKKQSAKITPKVEKKMEDVFNKHKTTLMDEFNSDEVTLELEAGPSASSSFLSRGNLFSLLGFNAGEDPAQAVRETLQEEIQLDKSPAKITVTDKVMIEKRVWMPSQEEIAQKTNDKLSLEWTDRPWLDMIERGISGFPWFLSNLNWTGEGKNRKRKSPSFSTSRSGTGIEVVVNDEKHNFGRGAAPPIKYISKLMKKFRTLISGR